MRRCRHQCSDFPLIPEIYHGSDDTISDTSLKSEGHGAVSSYTSQECGVQDAASVEVTGSLMSSKLYLLFH